MKQTILTLAAIFAGTVCPGSAATITFTDVADYGSGMQGQITIANDGSSPIVNWGLQFNFGATISSIYNATIVSHVGSVYDVSPLSYDSTIPVAGQVSFGFTAAPGNKVADHFVLSPAQVTQPPAPTVTFVTTSDYGSGFQGQITIDNTAPTTYSNWSLQFHLNGSISSIFGAKLTGHTGSTYDVAAESYNNVIAGGGSTSFGFTASPDRIAADQFVLSGTAGTQPNPPATVPEPSYTALVGLLVLAGGAIRGSRKPPGL